MINSQIMRFFMVLCCIAYFFTSCDYLSFKKKEDPMQTLDTIIDFSSVDTPPTFDACNSLIDKQEQLDCFGKELHKHISSSLIQSEFIVKKSIDETIEIKLQITNKGIVVLQAIQSSERVKKELPELENLIKESVKKFPTIYPAIKRDIPVTTEYIIPIRITV